MNVKGEDGIVDGIWQMMDGWDEIRDDHNTFWAFYDECSFYFRNVQPLFFLLFIVAG